MGFSDRHGPHHGAQKSTTTGVDFEASTTSCWKVAEVTSTAWADMGIPGKLTKRHLGNLGQAAVNSSAGMPHSEHVTRSFVPPLAFGASLLFQGNLSIGIVRSRYLTRLADEIDGLG